MRGARIYYPRVPGLMRDDHRRISSRCVTNRNSSCTTSLDHTRYKTLPAHTPDGPTRYKTLPAARLGGPPGTKLSQRARLGGPPGTKLSQQAPKRRFRPTFRMQGELCTASATNNPSRENFVPLPPPTTRAGRTLSRMRGRFRYKTLPAARLGGPPGTKLALLPGSAAHPVQNSPSERPWQAHPVQNSPSTPGSTTHPVQNSPRKRLGGPPGTKLSQQARLGGPPGTKLSQQAPKRRFWPTFRMQGELCTASATNTTSRANNFAHQHPTAPQQRAPLQISHAIRLNELSTKPRNVAIPTT